MTNCRIFMITNPNRTDIYTDIREIGEFRKEFGLEEPGILLLSFDADVMHRSLKVIIDPHSPGLKHYTGPIGFGFRAFYRHADKYDGLKAEGDRYIKHCYAGGNIASIEHHYGHASFCRVPFEVSAGWYRIGIAGTSHTTASKVDGHAELNADYLQGEKPTSTTDYNHLTIEFIPGVTIE